MKNFSTLYNYLHLSAWMIFVLVLLGISLLKEVVSTFIKKVKKHQCSYTKIPQARKKYKRYIITPTPHAIA